MSWSGCMDVMLSVFIRCRIDRLSRFQKWRQSLGHFWVDSRDAIASKKEHLSNRASLYLAPEVSMRRANIRDTPSPGIPFGDSIFLTTKADSVDSQREQLNDKMENCLNTFNIECHNWWATRTVCSYINSLLASL